MSEEWLDYLKEHAPHLHAEAVASVKHQAGWRDRRIEELEAEKADRIKTFEEWKAGVDESKELVDTIVNIALENENAELKAKLARVEEWLNNNTTHYLTSESEAPVLAGVCERIWYHATDDIESYPFTAVIDKALEKDDE